MNCMSESVIHKVFDAHVHVGYFPRKDGKGGETYYWSPARLMQYMQWAGVEEFIFSSTNASWDEHGETMHRETAEVLRLAQANGVKAHPFFWCSGDYLEWDSNLSKLPSFYEGLKLHGAETRWLERKADLCRILSIAEERHLPVQIHTGNDNLDACARYLPYCKKFPKVNFDLAHGHPLEEAGLALQECGNVWIDTSFMEIDEVKILWKLAPERIMYGSDFPAPLRFWDISATNYMRMRQRIMRKIGGEAMMKKNASAFLASVRNI